MDVRTEDTSKMAGSEGNPKDVQRSRGNLASTVFRASQTGQDLGAKSEAKSNARRAGLCTQELPGHEKFPAPTGDRDATEKSREASSNTAHSLPSEEPTVHSHCFMGRGVIQASAKEVFELVRIPQTRRFYDRMVRAGHIVESVQNLDSSKIASRDAASSKRTPNARGGSTTSEPELGDLLVHYTLFETNKCFLRYSRDFCTLQYACMVDGETPSNNASTPQEAAMDSVISQYPELRDVSRRRNNHRKSSSVRRPSRRYLIVSTSINHDSCPLREGVVRSTLHLSGWVIEPLSPSSPKCGGEALQPSCKVTYLVQVDFGGRVPVQLLNTISFRQPLCVHYVRKFIEAYRLRGGTVDELVRVALSPRILKIGRWGSRIALRPGARHGGSEKDLGEDGVPEEVIELLNNGF